jgi:hypothetical protein
MADMRHNKKHSIDNTDNHNGVSGATEDNLLSFDANGLPKDSGKTTAEVGLNSTHRGTTTGNPHAVTKAAVGLGNLANIVHNYTATTAPLKTDDSVTGGYSVGSHWYDIVHFQVYICMDATEDEAAWKLHGGSFVKNTTGGTVDKMKVIYQNVATGGVATFLIADKSTEITSRGTWALLIETLTTGQPFGFSLQKGYLSNLNTSAWSDGDDLWLGDDGDMVTARPDTPDHAVKIGHVVLSHATQGIIDLDIQNGYEIGELHDVDETSAIATAEDNDYVIAGDDSSSESPKTKFKMLFSTIWTYIWNKLTGTSPTIDGANFSNVGMTALESNLHNVMHAWNGAILETISITVTSNGTVVTANLEKSGGGDLTLSFSDNFSTFDCTPAATVSLAAGSYVSPTANYIYIPQSTKTLTASTSGFINYMPGRTIRKMEIVTGTLLI